MGSLGSHNLYHTVCYHNLLTLSTEIWDFTPFLLYLTVFYVPIDVSFDVSLVTYILRLYASLKNLSRPSNSTLFSSFVTSV